MRFPAGFVWGTATAAHQIEGNNVASDCWALEHAQPSVFAEASGDATDSWDRFAEDVALVRSLGLGAYRFSIEWARIEPERGSVSRAAIDHYRRIVDACRAADLLPVVTFHHFTQPRWLARLGGFAAVDFPNLFADHCGRLAEAIDGIGLACTINELNLPYWASEYFRTRASDAQRAAAERALGASLDTMFLFSPAEAILSNGIAAHRLARAAIKAERTELPVGMTLAISDEAAEPGAEAARDSRRERCYAPFLDAAAGDDFVGIQTYSRSTSRVDGTAGPAKDSPVTTMGWADCPAAVGEVCRWVASRWNLPIYVTENGYPGENDDRRAAFVREALDGVAGAISDGADVRGYFYWSLLDNFEWMLGYGQRFGLVAVDRSNFTRTPKPSAAVYAALVKEYS